MINQTSAIHEGESADETNWPLMKPERSWSQIKIFVVLLVAASATWCYIIG